MMDVALGCSRLMVSEITVSLTWRLGDSLG